MIRDGASVPRVLSRGGALLAQHAGRWLAVGRFQGHLVREYDAIFSLFFEPALDATPGALSGRCAARHVPISAPQHSDRETQISIG